VRFGALRGYDTRTAAVVVIGTALLIALPWIAVATGDATLTSLATRIMIYGLAAVSLDLVLGIGGMISFGHAAYFGLGGYVVGILAFHASSGDPLFGVLPGSNLVVIAWPAAVIVSAAVALVLGTLCLRTEGVSFIMITLAFAQVLYFFFVSLTIYGGDDGLLLHGRNVIAGYDLRNPILFYYVCFGLLAAFVVICRRLLDSPFGQIIQGARQNERRMAAVGVSTYRYKLVCFTIGGAAAGLAGALMANYARFVSPDLMNWTESGQLMVMVILGGVGTLFGPVLGAALIVGLEATLTSLTEHWKFILGPILILAVLFTRGGLFGLLTGQTRATNK
jgi:branched-chain amino acid transport system permease protein